MALLSIVIPAYCHHAQGYLLLKRCLQSLREQLWGDFEVIVVDDGSPQAYAPTNLEAEAPYRTQWLVLPENSGRAVARNVGWKTARGQWILFLDADMFLHPEATGAHFRFHARQGPGWIAQGRVIGQSNLDSVPVASVWTDASQAFFATGHVSVAREALERTQGFDEQFTQYGWEDLELGLRLRQLGYRRRSLSDAVSYHFEPLISPVQWSEDMSRERARAQGAVHLLRKHPKQGRLLCQATSGDAFLAAVVRAMVPVPRLLSFVLEQQSQNPKMALALYRGLLHQYYVEALQVALRKEASGF